MTKLRGVVVCIVVLLTMMMSVAAEGVASVVRGKVVDKSSNGPIEFATVVFFTKPDKKMAGGAVTNKMGVFVIENLKPGSYLVEVSFMGFKKQTLESVVVTGGSMDLGTLQMEASSENLEAVEVVAEKKKFEYRIDKKVVNVSSQSTTASMTAVEVLENVPSVKVDVEGNVMLRGSSGFTVLIDGKPSVLTGSDALRQIPASSIDNIEIITNPSAKYQPDGTAGIINVVMKKSKSKGVNGQVSANMGTYGTYGGDFLVNMQRKTFSAFIGGDYNNRKYPGEVEGIRETYKNNDTLFLNLSGNNDKWMLMQGLRAGIDLTVNKTNSATLGVRLGHMGMGNDGVLDYNERSASVGLIDNYKSVEHLKRGGDFYSVNGTWTHKFNEEGHKLIALFDVSARLMEENSSSELYDSNGIATEGKRNFEKGPGNKQEYRLDYTLPFSEVSKFEAGFQGRIGADGDDTRLDTLNTYTLVYETDPRYTKVTDGNQDIWAVYSTYSGMWKNLGYQAGLRGEYTYRVIEFGSDNFTVDRIDYFPTVHLSYQLPADNQLMGSYARRVERTRGYYFEPFITWQDAYNVRMGNPDLLPEFIDSYELGYVKQFERNFFSLEGYYRMTHNKLEMLSSVWDSPENSSGSILLNQPYNVGTDYTLGVEASYNFKIKKWYDGTLMGNLANYEVKGNLEGKDFANESFNWSTRFNNTFYPSENVQLQLNSSYNSATATAQGQNEDYYSLDAAVRADWLKRKLSTVLQVRDIFGTSDRESWSRGKTFYNYQHSIPKTPYVSLTVSYRFNNYNPKRQGSKNMGGDEGGGIEEF